MGARAGDDFSLLRQIIPKSIDAVIIITLEVGFFLFFSQLKKTFNKLSLAF